MCLYEYKYIHEYRYIKYPFLAIFPATWREKYTKHHFIIAFPPIITPHSYNFRILLASEFIITKYKILFPLMKNIKPLKFFQKFFPEFFLKLGYKKKTHPPLYFFNKILVNRFVRRNLR